MLSNWTIMPSDNEMSSYPERIEKVSTRIADLRNLISGYASLVKDKLDQAWLGHLLSVQFNQIDGSVQVKNQQMQSELTALYASFLTRLIRNPRAYDAVHPILITCPDWPVYKRSKKSLCEIATNDGLHQHGILLIPPADLRHRLKVPVQQHFQENQRYYMRNGIIRELAVDPIVPHDAAVVVDYALKGLKTNRISYDDAVIILPHPHHPNPRPYLGMIKAQNH
jgi:hypothetical protein